MNSENREHLRRALLGRLESLAATGVQALPRPRTPGAPPAAPSTIPLMPKSNTPEKKLETALARQTSGWGKASVGALFTEEVSPAATVSSAPTLEVLRQEVAQCTLCKELACTRKQTVFGVGHPRARLCFMGEAPGADEDRLGKPFVGRAGQLLDKIIVACKLKREEVYICNVLKCRPPGNRNPLPQEAANCRRFLDRQLELVQPEFICCLGAVAAQNLLNTPQSIGKLRGKVHSYRGAKVICTYHPAYLLRNPAAKKDAWEDMQFLMREMGLEM